VKARHIRYNLYVETDTLSHSVYEIIAIQIFACVILLFCWGREGRGLRCRVWYSVKASHNRHTLSDEPILYLSPFKSKKTVNLGGWGLDPTSNGGKAGARGTHMVPFKGYRFPISSL
jgi:hypothetical protein